MTRELPNLWITNVRGQRVHVFKNLAGQVAVFVYAPFPQAPKTGQMHYDPNSNTMFGFDGKDWKVIGDSILPTNNPVEYDDPTTMRAAGISVLGYEVMVSSSVPNDDVLVMGDTLFVNQATADRANEEITAGSGPTMIAMVQAVAAAQAQPREQQYTLDASALNVMQGYRAGRD